VHTFGPPWPTLFVVQVHPVRPLRRRAGGRIGSDEVVGGTLAAEAQSLGWVISYNAVDVQRV
jgi:hypothetical protein